MKNFDLTDYMKPMISKPGIIASRKNKYYLRSIAKLFSKDSSLDPPPKLTFPKFPKVTNIKKKKKIIGSYSFKVVGRVSRENYESLSPNHYNPNYDFLSKNNPRVVFGKQKIRLPVEKITKSTEPVMMKSYEMSPKVGGIPFEKQIYRKTIYFGENPNEKRFERIPNSSFANIHKIHSFASYTGRKPLYSEFLYQPEYKPKYSFVSKSFKTNNLCD